MAVIEDRTSEDHILRMIVQGTLLLHAAVTQELDDEFIRGLRELVRSYRVLAKAYDELLYSSY